MANRPICGDMGATNDQRSRGGHLRSNAGLNPFFAGKWRQNGEKDTQMGPNDLTRQATSKDVQLHTDLLGP